MVSVCKFGREREERERERERERESGCGRKKNRSTMWMDRGVRLNWCVCGESHADAACLSDLVTTSAVAAAAMVPAAASPASAER